MAGRKSLTPAQREARKLKMTEEFWADKKAKAATPQARALVAFDRLRAELADLPQPERDRWWSSLAKNLDDVVPRVQARAAQSGPPARPQS